MDSVLEEPGIPCSMRNQHAYDRGLGLGGVAFWAFGLGFGSIPYELETPEGLSTLCKDTAKTYKVVKDHQCSIEIQKARRGFDGLVVLHIEQSRGGSMTQGPALKDLRGLALGLRG